MNIETVDELAEKVADWVGCMKNAKERSAYMIQASRSVADSSPWNH